MATLSMAVRYRPVDFSDLTEQKSIVSILTNQVDTNSIQHAYLFSGPSGIGKTTSARIFADMIDSNVIEVDAASHSGVDNIRSIIESSKQRAIDAEYKVFVVDECHSLSSTAWQALLKLLEESPKYSIFILCTTNPEKIPDTILSRVQHFKFNRISKEGIINRLTEIYNKEKELRDISVSDEAIEYISKIADGGMRSAITMLDKCLSLSNSVDINIVLSAIDVVDYNSFIYLTTLLLNKDNSCIKEIDRLYNLGKDLNQFNIDYMKFLVDLMSYSLFSNIDKTSLPNDKELLENIDSLKLNDNNDKLLDILKMTKKLVEDSRYRSDLKSLINTTYLIYCGE